MWFFQTTKASFSAPETAEIIQTRQCCLSVHRAPWQCYIPPPPLTFALLYMGPRGSHRTSSENTGHWNIPLLTILCSLPISFYWLLWQNSCLQISPAKTYAPTSRRPVKLFQELSHHAPLCPMAVPT